MSNWLVGSRRKRAAQELVFFQAGPPEHPSAQKSSHWCHMRRCGSNDNLKQRQICEDMQRLSPGGLCSSLPRPLLWYHGTAMCTLYFKNIRTRIGKRITNSLHPHPRQTYTSQPTTATAAAAATTVTTPTRLSLPPLSLPQFNRIQSDHPISSNPAFSDSVIKC